MSLNVASHNNFELKYINPCYHVIIITDKSTRVSIKYYECVHFCLNSSHEKFISTSNYQRVKKELSTKFL
jgi:hypothetical protein